MTNKKKRSLLTVLFMILAMVISKLLGMLRSVLLASAYGISEEATAFSAASRIPLSFFDIVFASAILGCFIPVYNSFQGDKHKDRSEFASIYLNFMLLLTGLLSLFGVIFAPQILSVIAPDMLESTALISATLLRVMFPLIVFAAASYTLVGVLQSCGKFIAPAFISAVSNILVIIYFLFFNDRFGIYGLAVSYTAGWFVQLLTLVFSLSKTGFSYKFLFAFKNKAFIKALKLTPLIIMGSWLAPMCMLFSMRAALTTGISGAVPSFEYAINLFTVITGITTYGICNYIFPELSTLAATDDEKGFSDTCKNGLSSALILTIPICACVLSLAPYGVSIIYMRGSFDIYAAEQVTSILKALVPGMIGFTLTEVISRIFYALKSPKYPVVSVVAGVVLNAVFCYLLCDVFSFGLGALGIAYSIAILGAGIMMFVFACVKIHGFFEKGYFVNLLKILLSGVFSSAVMIFIDRLVGISPFTCSIFVNILIAVVIALVGIAAYVITLLVLREENSLGVIRSLKKR